MTDRDRAEASIAPPASPPDPSRRRFFRQVAGEVLTGAARLAGAVEDVRARSASEAALLLGGPSPAAFAAPDEILSASASGSESAAAGFRTPFRFESDDVLLVLDQRRLPDELVEIRVRNGAEAAAAIRDMAVRGAPAIGQVAAIGLALTARQAADTRPYARRSILGAAADVLVAARPTAVNLRWAVERLMARYRQLGEVSEDGAAIAVALHDEAMAIVAEATDDHGRIAVAGLSILPRPADRPLSLLTHCNTGPLAAGQFGTALGVVQAAHHADLPIHVWVDETRPYLQGARLTAWELAQAGVPHTLIPDMAAGPLMAAGEVDAVLVGADRVAANGDVANKIGTYTLAVLAARHGVPFLVCVPMSSVDLDTADGGTIPIEERSAEEVTAIRGVRIAPDGTQVRNPAFDITPAELVTAIVTEEGVLRAPYPDALAAAATRRASRRQGLRADEPVASSPVGAGRG